jgi:oxygen-independent coproporphyrinogen III oxidase
MNAHFIEKYDRRVPRYTSYPTAPHFSPEIDDAAYGAWLHELPEGKPVSIYLHVPFCAELCWYCGCHTGVARTHRPIAQYVELLDREIELVAAGLRHRTQIAHLHWGGGTPNTLQADEIAGLVARLRQHFDVAPDAEISAEFDPRILSEEIVEAFAASGANRASLGVQDIDATVQKAINRIQPFETTANAVAWLRRAGIRGINFDLVYGLPHQTTEGLKQTIDRIVELEPDRIAVFGYAHVPWMRPHQKLIDESVLPDMEERLRQCSAIAERLTHHGYAAIGLDHFARADDPLARRRRNGELHRNFQGYTTDACDTLLGFGESSIGSLPQGYVQNTTDITRYRERIQSGRLATQRGIRFKGQDRLRRDVIERLMCDLAVDLEAVAERHGVAPDVFAEDVRRLEPLAEDGLVRQEGWRISVTEEARPFVRAACAAFDTYLSERSDRHSQMV